MGKKKNETEGTGMNAEQLGGMLQNAYANCNDGRMEEAILKLSECREERRTAGATLYSAIEFRPWDGNYYDPKEWRRDVTKAIHKLYESASLLEQLQNHGSELSEVLFSELNEIFEEPLYVMDPVLESKITPEKYTPLFTELLELLVDIADRYTKAGEIPVEVRLSDIENLEKKLVHLGRELKEDRKYGHYTGVLRNVEKIAEALNHP